MTKKRREKKFRLSLIYWMLILFVFSLIYGFFNTQSRSSSISLAGFLSKNWRNGLSFQETILDTQVFWGEIWFNISLTLLIAFIWIKRMPIRVELDYKSFIFSIKREIKKYWKLLRGSFIILSFILLLMLIAGFPDQNLFENWYPTHFSYQMSVYPALLASMLLLTAPLKNFKEKNAILEKTNAGNYKIIFHKVLIIIFSVMWLIMLIPTKFDLHAFMNFEIQVHTWLYTLSFPMCVFVFILSLEKYYNYNGKDEKSPTSVGSRQKNAFSMENYLITI
ncbi:MAG: hypothetical protein ACTSRZ_06980 [Promethearchaeota archaeon]